ncbi:hypothetical protein BEL04_08380 [Mucilaginibacter sp. PPCGB 2223]|uniref:hypothetical protein n=1 Tax=Mucilaginibacter sp. PPCGB 2223 TaxID=1886027 RepID=UPI000825B5A7|nr:hypothetical protein [Mucilaginibacter sp. PPCGB 2223]OCX54264.1 hypothetical protein BEL04_08380 [Mucilaginibacter sp. PPCGB 2223]
MSPEYRAAVLKAYQEKRDSGNLSPNLIEPKSGTLKAECVTAFDWYQSTDEATLQLFYGKKDNEKAYKQAVKNGVAETTFKALNNFLNDRTEAPVDRTIELLAFLIDFRPRPYRYGWKPNETQGETGGKTPPPPPPVNEDDDDTGETIKENLLARWMRFVNRKNIAITALVIATLTGGLYALKNSAGKPPIKKTDSLSLSVIPTRHMYWNNDHYDTIPGSTPNSAPVLTLDTFRLAHFRQITDTSQINAQSIGHVWYFKTAKGLACFTAGGAYPLDTNRRLKPITLYMIDKYFHR